MKYIICYDIKEDRVRARVVKYLEARALRVQYSVWFRRQTRRMCCAGWKERARYETYMDRPYREYGGKTSRERIDAFVASFAQKLRKGVHEDSCSSLSPS